MTAAPEKIWVLSPLSLLWRCPGWQVTKVQLPHWESLALELLLGFHLRLMLLLLQSELINLFIVKVPRLHRERLLRKPITQMVVILRR